MPHLLALNNYRLQLKSITAKSPEQFWCEQLVPELWLEAVTTAGGAGWHLAYPNLAGLSAGQTSGQPAALGHAAPFQLDPAFEPMKGQAVC